MRFYKIALAAVAVVILWPHSFLSAEGASWLRGQVRANALNPNISVLADVVGLAGPRGDTDSNRFALREAEIGLQAAVDPYARADFFIGIPEGESPELEEGYFTLLALPWGFQARGGKFLANFGRMNMVHRHERPQADSPPAVEMFLGAEGLNDTGLEVSRQFTPFGLFTELSYGALNGLGEMSAGAVDESSRTLRSFAHVARFRVYQDISEAANLEMGVSGGLREPEGGERRRLGGLDLTFRWRPLRQGLYRSFLWRAEGFYSSLKSTSSAAGLDRRGGYSYIEYQPARRWRFGLRGDYAEDPEVRTMERAITRGFSPYATFVVSEFQRFRLQYSGVRRPDGEKEGRGYLQWTVILGPHGGHPF